VSTSRGVPAEVAALPWYHTIKLPGGVPTPGLCSGQPVLRGGPLVLTALAPRSPLFGMWRLGMQQWWLPGMAGHRRLLKAAGFRVAAHGGPVSQRFGKGLHRRRLRDVRSAAALRFVLAHQRFLPSQWVLARPA